MGRFSLDVGILAIPGAAFLPNGRNSCELRVSFSLITEGEMEEACARLASLVEQAWADYVHIANGALARTGEPQLAYEGKGSLTTTRIRPAVNCVGISSESPL